MRRLKLIFLSISILLIALPQVASAQSSWEQTQRERSGTTISFLAHLSTIAMIRTSSHQIIAYTASLDLAAYNHLLCLLKRQLQNFDVFQ